MPLPPRPSITKLCVNDSEIPDRYQLNINNRNHDLIQMLQEMDEEERGLLQEALDQ